MLALMLAIFSSCVPANFTTAEELSSHTNPSISEELSAHNDGLTFTVTSVTPTNFGDHFEHGQLSVTIHNLASYEIEILDGVEFQINHNGNWITQSGSASDGNPMILPPGEAREVTFGWGVPGEAGEFRLVQNIIHVGEPQRAYIHFAIENENIPQDRTGAFVEVYATTPTSITLQITNGYASGNIYMDGFYSILQTNGEEVPQIATFEAINPNHEPFDPRRETTRIIGARQIRNITLHWGWLYGEIPPGEYTIWKSLRHEMYEGNNIWRGTLMDTPTRFTVKEERYAPNADPNMWFGDEVTFRATVIENNYYEIGWLGQTLLVRCSDGWRYHVSAPAGAVLNASGTPIPFESIQLGANLEITHSGIVLQSDPTIVGYVIQIKIIE